MKVTTTQDKVDSVIERWEAAYPPRPSRIVALPELAPEPDWKDSVADRLRALGPNKTAEQVNAVIGNASWTTLTCKACGEDVPAVAELYDDETEWGGVTVVICLACAQAAVAALTNPKAHGEPVSEAEAST